MGSQATLSILITAKDAVSATFKSVGSSATALEKSLGAPMRAASGLTSALGTVGVAALGVKAIAEGVSGAVDALVGPAMESQKVAAQTAAVIASTHGVAGMTADA